MFKHTCSVNCPYLAYFRGTKALYICKIYYTTVIDMNDALKELKSKFIIYQGQFEEERTPMLIEKVLKFVRVSKDGKVIFQTRGALNNINQVKLVLVARFLANKLEPSISSEVSVNEIVDFTGIEIKQVSARLSTFVNERFAIRSERGVFSVAPFFVEVFLNEIDKRSNSYDSVIVSGRPMTTVKSAPKGGGASSRIRKLKDDNFFAKPKTITDVRNALEHIGHHYRSSALSPALLFFIRRGELRRMKEDGQWVYVNP
jgi:hypothetical protein